MKSEEYKKRLENLGVKDIGKAVDDLFSSMGYVGRLLFWYWHFKEHERMTTSNSGLNKQEGEKNK